MDMENKTRDEKLQYDINREVAKKSASLSGQSDKCENLTGEETLSSNQSRMIQQIKFRCSPL